MAKPLSPALPLLLLHLASFLPPSLSSFATEAFLYGGCSQQKCAPPSPYTSNLDSLLTSLVNSATFSSYNNITVSGPTSSDTARGLYHCRGDLSMPDCATCVSRAVSRLPSSICPGACGGAVQLAGCYLKYDNTSFLGVEDKTVILKKCGPSEGYDAEASERRDAVLNGLLNGGAGMGFFRSGGSEGVQGVAQCVGDLAAAECQDCLSTAAGGLKSECGTAKYGDMFLGKCYVRYFTGGAPSYANSHNDQSNHDGERTFAIIMGLLAGVALLIIFFLFLRRIFCGNGK